MENKAEVREFLATRRAKLDAPYVGEEFTPNTVRRPRMSPAPGKAIGVRDVQCFVLWVVKMVGHFHS
jgi:hypothetical protein